MDERNQKIMKIPIPDRIPSLQSFKFACFSRGSLYIAGYGRYPHLWGTTGGNAEKRILEQMKQSNAVGN